MLTHNGKHFLKDETPLFLNSGEMHYFRIDPKLWPVHLDKIKSAGLNAVCSYVPWDWHEESQGQFDFDGQSHPGKNLELWLKLAQERELMVTLKPGPYILAEYRGAGLPFWFIDRYAKQCRTKDRQGNPCQIDAMTFMDPVYLEHVSAWYAQIMPWIRDRQISQGGPVAMLQVCNEVGVYTWLAEQADYSEPCLLEYRNYLKGLYAADIQELNQLYQTDYSDFEQVEPPSDQKLPYESRVQFAKDTDWHLFWRDYYAKYLRLLIGKISDYGLDVPFYHNLPGWIYGSAYEFPLNISMYQESYYKDYPKLIFGVDHIPEYVSYRNRHDDRIVNDIVLAMQKGGPLFAAEFQAGSREYQVATSPKEMELFYKASLAHGLVGWNYYMFSQGQNQQGKGFTGKTFYWYTPLDHQAQEGTLYPVAQKMSKLLNPIEKTVLGSKRKAKVAVLFYAPYYSTELAKEIDLAKLGLDYDPQKVRRGAYFDGLLKALQNINLDYDMLDLQSCTPSDMAEYEQVWLFSLDFMDKFSQKKLLVYVREGGKLVIYPTVPKLDLHLQSCTVLYDQLGIKSAEKSDVDLPLLSVLDRKDVKCLAPVITYSLESQEAKPVAHLLGDQLCGFEQMLDLGTITVLGFSLGFDTEDHPDVYEMLVQRSATHLRSAQSSGSRLAVLERFCDEQALLFVGNYYQEPFAEKIHYTHPRTGQQCSLPCGSSHLNIPEIYGFLSPIALPLKDDLRLRHSTLDILQIDSSAKNLRLTVQGHPGLTGEIAFEGDTQMISTVSLEGQELELKSKDDCTWISVPGLSDPLQVEVSLHVAGH